MTKTDSSTMTTMAGSPPASRDAGVEMGLDVERLAEAHDYLGGMYSWNDAYLDNPANGHLWVTRAALILRELVGRPSRDPYAAAREKP